MNGVGILGAIVIGLVAGWIAEKVMRRRHGCLTNLVVGLVGSFIGLWLADAFDVRVGAGWGASLLTSTVGAIVLLFVVGLIGGRR